MACESENGAHEYLFHQVGDGVFVRKCYGLEELASNMEEHCDGFTHLTSTAAVSIPSAPPRQDGDTIEAHIHSAWIAFRHYTPAIACKTLRLPDGDQRFAFRYTVPRSEEDVHRWVEETVFFVDGNGKEKGMYERHCELKDGRWWRCSDDHYIAELHVARRAAADDWLFSMVFSHNSIDGRNAFAMLDLFFRFLRAELEGSAAPISSIEWGTEAVRLPPPGAFTMALAESGSPPDIAPPKPEVAPPQQVLEEVVETPPALIPWLYAPHPTDGVGDVSRLVAFSEATTERLHAACRRKGYTITQAITALSALAHTEAALCAAGDLGTERFREVGGAFEAATHYLVAWNFINHRHKFPGGYDSYDSPGSTALCTADGVPLFLQMDGIRGCIELEEEMMSARRIANEDAFWDVLVRGVADAWKAIDSSLEGYMTRSLANHHGIDTFNPHMFDVPALIVSSIGDLRRLNILQGEGPSLVVKDVICGIRVRMPPVMNLLWEYNGRISCHFMSAGEYTTSAELERITQLYEEWTEALIGE